MKAIGIILSVVFFQMIFAPPVAALTDLREIVMEGLLVNDAGKAERFRRYSEKSGVPISEIGKVLVTFAEDETLSKYLRDVAIDVIGDLGFEEALPVLKKISRSADNTMRGSAVHAVIKIGGDGLPDFAHQVFNDRQHYSRSNRFVLYRSLSRYYMKSGSPRKDSDIRHSLREFFSDAVGEEPDTSNLKLLDENLRDCDVRYKTSYEREEVLKKIERSVVDSDRAYASEELETLWKLPKEKRTRMKTGKSPEK